jgi:hypothetical protein
MTRHIYTVFVTFWRRETLHILQRLTVIQYDWHIQDSNDKAVKWSFKVAQISQTLYERSNTPSKDVLQMHEYKEKLT